MTQHTPEARFFAPGGFAPVGAPTAPRNPYSYTSGLQTILRDDIYAPVGAKNPAPLRGDLSYEPVVGAARLRATRNVAPANDPALLLGGLSDPAHARVRPAKGASKVHKPAKAKAPAKKRPDLGNVVLNILLIAGAAILIASVAFNATSGTPSVIAGWSASTVLTGSMADVYPKGSLVVTRHVDPVELKVGDDIRYMASETDTITHRIVEVVPDVEGTGQLGFRTQGTQNPYPDGEPVVAQNVLGRVVFSSKPLGDAVTLLKNYWAIPVFLVALAIGTKKLLARINADTEKGAVTAAEGGEPKTNRPAGPAAGARAKAARASVCARARDGTGGRKGGAGAAAT